MFPVAIKSLGLDLFRKFIVVSSADFGPNESFECLVEVNGTAKPA